jgi:hypothetical protein
MTNGGASDYRVGSGKKSLDYLDLSLSQKRSVSEMLVSDYSVTLMGEVLDCIISPSSALYFVSFRVSTCSRYTAIWMDIRNREAVEIGYVAQNGGKERHFRSTRGAHDGCHLEDGRYTAKDKGLGCAI